jgi:DNA-binding NarL/FixJ family response regulator
LPDCSGLDLLKILHQNHPKIAVLMLSTYAEDIYKEKALSYGAAGYLTKGTSLETLVSACVFHANWTPIPRQTGQSERSDAGVIVLL